MRTSIAAGALALALFCAQTAEGQSGKNRHTDEDAWGGNIFLFGGQKQLDEDDWEPVEDHLEIALLIDVRPPRWPINLVIDNRYSFDDDEDDFGIEYDVETWEWNLGVRRYFQLEDSGFHVLVGAGVTIGSATVDVSFEGFDDYDTDRGVGYWLDVGGMFVVEGGFTFGVELSYSSWDVEGEVLGEEHLEERPGEELDADFRR